MWLWNVSSKIINKKVNTVIIHKQESNSSLTRIKTEIN